MVDMDWDDNGAGFGLQGTVNRPRENDPDSKRGLYRKFQVIRITPSEKHKNCRYFVLDVDHDKFAAAAIAAYADACEKDYPLLAADLRSGSVGWD